MNIKLFDSFGIEKGIYPSFDLYRTDSSGRKFYLGYFTTLEGALKEFLSLKIAGSKANSINDLVSYLKWLEKRACSCLTTTENQSELNKLEAEQ